jgi:mono/diheme cytochrome c family protein
MRLPLFAIGLAFGLALSAAPLFAADAVGTPEQIEFYKKEVLPILEEHCYKCHGAGKSKGGLNLAGRAAILKGGESGPGVDLQNVPESPLLQAVNYNGFEMPPSGKLPKEKIALLTKWVEIGLPMPAGEAAPVVEHKGPPQVTDETKNHWSFRKVVRPAVPAVKQADWVANPIDAFILAKLEANGLSPNPPAPPQHLIRRLNYDLVGLPPTIEAVQKFSTEPTTDTYKALVEELLKSPHHGEQFARYWLDLVRYAETNSFERDNAKPFVWRYRDYVIQYFNSDKPYNQFILEQLAGDELDQPTRDSLIATGFYRLGLWDDEPADPELAFYDGIDDIVGTTAQSFLGLTMNCARCHDHKLDPLPQADYYRFAAFFRNIRHYGQRSDESVFANSIRSIATPEEETQSAEDKLRWEQTVTALRKQLDAVEDRIRPNLKGGEKDDFERDGERLRVIRKHVGDLITDDELTDYARIRREWTELRNRPPRSLSQALVITEHGDKPPATHILIRGNAHAEGDQVEPAFPAVLSPPAPKVHAVADHKSSGRRRALAEWIASPENPLTARVMVNRIWQWHFGRGIVPSTNNFGLQGDAPTHPELLDWLAAEFVESGWNIRHVHRQILSSNTYKMSSAGQETALQKDPQNQLFWRFDMRRLRAEEIRDSILAVNDTLNLESMFGPSIYPVIEKEVLAGQSVPGAGWNQSSDEDRRRRSIYIHLKRSLTVPLLANFDVADTDFTCPIRFATTQPTQALSMLNSAFLQEESHRLAELLRQNAGSELASQVKFALKRALQREPTEKEVDRGVALIQSLTQEFGQKPEAALKYFCLTVLNMNEFVYLD